MSKTLAALLATIVIIALCLARTREYLPPVAEPPPDSTDSAAAADPNDRVAIARVQHNDQIREAYHAAAVEYPGEIYLRWLKREAVLELWARNPGRRFRLIATYPILASSGGPGPKRREGDGQVPEGFYEVDRLNPESAFHLSLGLNYPNAADLVLSDREHPGGDIFIHGGDVSIGCAPLGDDAIEEVYLAALDAHDHGQSRIEVHVFPGLMSGPLWAQYASEQIGRHPALEAFWAQLQRGFDYFEQRRVLPVVTVGEDGRYVLGGGN